MGTFDGTVAASGGEGSLGPDDAGESSGVATDSGSSGSSTGAEGFVPPGCFGDDFEDGIVDGELWNTWAEENSSFAELAGTFEFTPPTYGLFDTGLVSTYLYEIPFDAAWARVQVVSAPAPTRPVALFLQVIEQPRVLSIRIGGGTLGVDVTDDEMPLFGESFPADPPPGWIGIRGEGNVVHFETSDDGITWTTLATWDQPSPFTAAHPLIMAQTYGDDVEGGIVVVDDFEACVE